MLCLGIPWIGEFITHYLLHKMGPCDSFLVRLLLDLCPLFTVNAKVYFKILYQTKQIQFSQGVAVFMVLVCNAKVMHRMRRVAGRVIYRASLRSSTSTRTTRMTTGNTDDVATVRAELGRLLSRLSSRSSSRGQERRREARYQEEEEVEMIGQEM